MNIDFQSHRTQLVVTELAASAATVGLFSAYNAHVRRLKRLELDRDLKRSLASKPAPTAERTLLRPQSPIELRERRTAVAWDAGQEYDEDLVREQLARNYVFFGDEGMEKIRKGKVVVVGCGGVGSWAAVMLVRSYVPHSFSAV